MLNNNVKILRKLENYGMLQIILALNNTSLRASELQVSIDCSNDPYYNARKNLEEIGIITKEIDVGSSYVRYILTDKGKRIAEHLQNISHIISE